MIQEREILRCEGEFVTYRWRDAKTRSWQTRTVTGVEFLRLVLQHVLPKGFRRARNYGLLHPNCKRGVALLRMLALRRRPEVMHEVMPDSSRSASTPTRPALLCRCCGSAMRIVRRRILPGSLALAAPPPTKAEGQPTR